jgi:hypothetical protein
MTQEFIPYQQALALKELGFDEPCFRFQNNISNIIEEKSWLNWNEVEQFVSFPLYQQAFRWFREKQEIEGFVHKSIEGNYYFVIKRIGNNESNMYEFTKTSPKTFDTYEEAELACLKKLIEIVKTKNI